MDKCAVVSLQTAVRLVEPTMTELFLVVMYGTGDFFPKLPMFLMFQNISCKFIALFRDLERFILSC